MKSLVYLITGISVVAALAGCSDRFSGDEVTSPKDQIVISAQMDARSVKAVALPTSELNNIQFLHKNATTVPSDFSKAAALLGNREGTTVGAITFATLTAPKYSVDGKNAYFVAYHPEADKVSGAVGKVKWTIDGKSDILLTKNIYDAGTYVAPKTGAGGDAGEPMVFSHLLAQLEVICKVKAGDKDEVQATWGKVTRIQLLDTPGEFYFDYATLNVTPGDLVDKSLLKADYATTYPTSGEELLETPNPAVTAAGMFAPKTDTDPIKLRIRTTLGGELDVPVQLYNDAGDEPISFAAGAKYTITLTFTKDFNRIEVGTPTITDWDNKYTADAEDEVGI